MKGNVGGLTVGNCKVGYNQNPFTVEPANSVREPSRRRLWLFLLIVLEAAIVVPLYEVVLERERRERSRDCNGVFFTNPSDDRNLK